MKKNIIIFYESHTDSTPAKVIKKLAAPFQTVGIKAFAIEDPKGENPLKYITQKLISPELAKHLEHITTLLDDPSNHKNELDTYIQHFYYSENRLYQTQEEFNSLDEISKVNLLRAHFVRICGNIEAEQVILAGLRRS